VYDVLHQKYNQDIHQQRHQNTNNLSHLDFVQLNKMKEYFCEYVEKFDDNQTSEGNRADHIERFTSEEDLNKYHDDCPLNKNKLYLIDGYEHPI